MGLLLCDTSTKRVFEIEVKKRDQPKCERKKKDSVVKAFVGPRKRYDVGAIDHQSQIILSSGLTRVDLVNKFIMVLFSLVF